MRFFHFAASLALLAACSSPPRNLSEPKTASEMAPARSSAMSVEQAQKVLDDANAKLFAEDQQNPLRNPKSLDDVLEILRSDQIDLFPGALEYASKDGSPRAKVLAAQIEVAWGENLRIVAQTLDLLATDLRQEERELEEAKAVGKLDADGQRRLDVLNATIERETTMIAALSRLAPAHLARGATLAEALVKEAPEGYEGYRVLADYHRIRGEWDRYDAMVKEVETRNPDSTGLLFLKGIALSEREGNLDAATKLLATAVAKDPKFCRAQAQIVFLATGLTKKREEYLKLRAMNDHHQLVVLAGPVIENVYDARERRRAQVRRVDWRASEN